MKNFRLLILSFLLLLGGTIQAQKTISGVVTEASQMGLPGVSIVVNNSTKGTSTDFDGNYILENVNEGDVLTFSFMGFKTKEITVSSEDKINVSLEEESEFLDEVVLVGYGTARKKDLTGSVDMVNEKDFAEGPATSAGQLIQGKVAGVNISSASGAPGEGQNIRIRGTGSLSLTSNPLIVVDGVPLSDSGVGGSRNTLNSINPNDIASMTVLKDASSTAIYGSRAANGVILITTKKGRLDQDIKVSFNSQTGISTVNDYVDVMSADQFSSFINATGTPDEIARLGGANTNWQQEIYQTAITTDNNLSVSGSAGNLPYRVSFGYTDAEGILKTDDFKRSTGKVTLTPTFFDDHLKVEVNANGSQERNQFADRGAIGAAVGYDPTQPVYDENSQYAGYSYWEDPATGNRYNLAPNNPMAMLELKDDQSTVNRFIGNAKFDYKLHFAPEVTATLNLGYDDSSSNGTTSVSPNMPTSSPEFNGMYNQYSAQATNQLLDFYLNYDKELNDKNHFGVMAGYSYQKFTFENEATSTEYFKTLDDRVITTVDSNANTLISFFGRANYNYDDKYLITATLRADASSKLNPDDRWGYFPSVALAWNMSNEDFLKDSEVVNNLKLRIGYGQVGNVNGLNDYQFLTRYSQSVAGASYQLGDNFYQTYRPEPINEDLRWEVGSTFNVGIDYSLYDNRVFGSLEVYSKMTQDLIAQTTVDPMTNFGNVIDANIGDMINNGIEYSLNFVPVRTDDWDWTVNTNIAYNHNEITNMPDVQNVGGIAGGTGNTIQRHEEGYAPYSFYVYEQVYDDNGKPIEGAYVDRNGDGIISDDDRYYAGDPYADITLGLSTQVSYKNWDLGMTTRASFGNYVYDNVSSSISYEQRATENMILSNLSTDYYNTGFEYLTETNLMSDYYVQDARFFKIDNITLGYTFPEQLIKDVNFRIYGSADNILTVSPYEGLDPEIPGGIDNNFYPRPQTYTLGLNINF